MSLGPKEAEPTAPVPALGRCHLVYDKVVAILGSASSGANIATAPLVSRAGIPQIGTLSTNPLVTVDEKGNVRPWMFRICFIDPYQGRLIGYFAAKELKSIGFMKEAAE